MKHPQAPSDAGFTLIELLVAFVLLGFLMSLLYGSFTFAGRVAVKTSENSEASFETFQTQDFLAELLNNIYPEKNIFRGTQDKLTFLSSLNRDGMAQGLYKITLQLVRQADHTNLTMSWLAVHKENQQPQYSEGSMILLENVGRMGFSYLSNLSSDAQPIWLSTWDQEGALPTHIRVRVESGSGKAMSWPEQIIKINITHNVDCLYDPVSRGCTYR